MISILRGIAFVIGTAWSFVHYPEDPALSLLAGMLVGFGGFLAGLGYYGPSNSVPWEAWAIIAAVSIGVAAHSLGRWVGLEGRSITPERDP